MYNAKSFDRLPHTAKGNAAETVITMLTVMDLPEPLYVDSMLKDRDATEHFLTAITTDITKEDTPSIDTVNRMYSPLYFVSFHPPIVAGFPCQRKAYSHAPSLSDAPAHAYTGERGSLSSPSVAVGFHCPRSSYPCHSVNRYIFPPLVRCGAEC